MQKFNKSVVTTVVAAAVGIIPFQSTFAGGGVFDALDDCIALEDDYKNRSGNFFTDINFQISETPTTLPTGTYTTVWWKQKNKSLLEVYKKTPDASKHKKYGIDANTGFEMWKEDQITLYGGPEEIKKLITKHYRSARQDFLEKDKSDGANSLSEEKKDLDRDCPAGVGDQMLRAALKIGMTPISTISRNLEISKKENTPVTKLIAAQTGISIKDIERHGLGGGENSEVRKAGRAIAKVFGW